MSDFIFNADAYLKRIGIMESVEPTLEFLRKITRAHLLEVPFENLEVTDEKKEPSLNTKDLFEKIVNLGRGGYCFELNKLFYLLLQGLGFECRAVAARVINNRPEPCPISHRATVVTIDGNRYFCDVGFGGAGPKDVLSLETEEEQTAAGERFRVIRENGDYVIIRYEEDRLERVMRFRDEPWLDVDFLTLSRYYATYPHSPFRNKRILYRCTYNGWISLADRVFTEYTDGIKTVSTLDTEPQIEAIIAEYFGLTLPKPVNK